jgi:hypothetical protein
MGKRYSEHAELEQRRRWRDPEGGGALVDMRIDIEFQNQLIMAAGGRWDRQLDDYDSDEPGLADPRRATSRLVIRPHAGQIEALLWFKGWLNVHAGRRNHPPAFDAAAIAKLDSDIVDPAEVYSEMFAGGRRGGKTWMAALICAMYAVQFSDAIVWVVNPSDQKHDEVRDYMEHLLAREWIAWETVADGWGIVNGSTISLKSAYTGTDPDAIKEGKAHLVWMNEGQKMHKRVFTVARGAISDNSGLVLVCANPPVEAKDQQWVGDFAADAQAGRQMSAYHHFDPLQNPHINRLALMALRKEVDIRTYRIEVLGEFLPPADTVAYNWIRTKDGNERSAPVSGPIGKRPDQHRTPESIWVDVTAEFLQFVAEEGDGYTDLPGIDFQMHPHMGGPVFRIYAPVGEAPTKDNVVMWGVDEIVIQGDEDAWCEEAKAHGYRNASTLIVADGTGGYQHSRRGDADAPPTWKGRGSFDILNMGGFWNVVPPSRRIKNNNPHVLDRVRSLTSMIETADRRRRLFIDPVRCPKTAKSIREWPTTNGKPSRTHPAAHLGDGASYPIIRLFPRILRADRADEVDPIKELVDQQPSLAESTKFLGPPRKPSPRDGRRTL